MFNTTNPLCFCNLQNYKIMLTEEDLWLFVCVSVIVLRSAQPVKHITALYQRYPCSRENRRRESTRVRVTRREQ